LLTGLIIGTLDTGLKSVELWKRAFHLDESENRRTKDRK
jgi:hypothetical protein